MKGRYVVYFCLISIVLGGLAVTYVPLPQTKSSYDRPEEHYDENEIEVEEEAPSSSSWNSSTGKDNTKCAKDYDRPKNLERLPRETVEPREDRYVNEYEYQEEPSWKPETEVNMEPRASAYEVTRYPGEIPNETQLMAAWELYNKSYEAASENGWFKFENAIEDGYRKIDPPHYINVERSFDGEDLNPRKPEQLVYYNNPKDEESKILAGFMYTTEDEGDQVGGPLTLWHYHPVLNPEGSRILREMIDESNDVKESDVEKALTLETEKHRTVEMIHVWFIKHPEGPFATSMTPPGECLARPEKLEREEFANYTLAKYDKRFR